MTSLVVTVVSVAGKCLVREPPDTFTPPQDTDAGFYISVNGNPEFYDPGQLYTVTLRVRTDLYFFI